MKGRFPGTRAGTSIIDDFPATKCFYNVFFFLSLLSKVKAFKQDKNLSL